MKPAGPIRTISCPVASTTMPSPSRIAMKGNSRSPIFHSTSPTAPVRSSPWFASSLRCERESVLSYEVPMSSEAYMRGPSG